MDEPVMNQYAPPTANVEDMTRSSGVAELNLFSAQGRIGRIRYLAYIAGSSVIHSGVSTAATMALGGSGLAVAIGIALLAALIWFLAITGIKRCHDMNISGWWTLTSFIPIIGLAWIFWPGTQGDNRFGPPPPANNWGVRILGLIFPVIAFIGILAAVAIPQYKDYATKARATQQQAPK